MDYLQTIGWVGNAGFLVGAWAFPRKYVRLSLLLNLFGNAAYFLQGYLMENWSLVAISFALAYFNVEGVYRWRNFDPRT
jgi:hypothetical protein